MPKASLFWNRVLGPTISRYGWYLIVIPLVLANIGALRAASAPKVYRSSTSLTIGNTLVDLAIGQPDTTGLLLVNRELGVALAGDTISKVTMAPGTVLSGRIISDTYQIVLEASSSTPKAARDAADSYAKTYVAESSRRRKEALEKAADFFSTSLANAERELARSDSTYRNFYENRVNDLRARLLTAEELASRPSSTTIAQDAPAFLPGAPVNRPATTAAILGFIFGLGICGAIILILDFGEKQRVSLDDIKGVRPDLPILGVTRVRNLKSAALVGHGIQTSATLAESIVVCTAYVGARMKTHLVSTAVVSALQASGSRAVQVRLEDAPGINDVLFQKTSSSLWTVALGHPSLALDAREGVRKRIVDEQLDIAVVDGPAIRDTRAKSVGFEVADHVVLVIDSTSASTEQVAEAMLVLESFNRPILGAIFLPR